VPTVPQFSATVFTSDTAALRDLYADLFALDVVTDIGWFVSLSRLGAPWELCLWDPDHESVPAAARPSVDAATGPVLAFVVDDVDALEQAARARGVEVLAPVVDEPWGQRHVFLRDPVGTVIDVVQITAPDPAWLAAHGIDPAEVPTPT
jgi:catechol 2,3-dioxygenase-like lactoylglutathione lyase family enzyme